jgi:hypothetical protein
MIWPVSRPWEAAAVSSRSKGFISPEGGGFSGPCHGHAQITEGAQRDLAVGTTPLPAELVCGRVELADGNGALPLLKQPHVGGAPLSQGQDVIAQVDVVEPQAAEGGVQRLVGLPGLRGHERLCANNRGAYGAFANSPAAQQANSQGKSNSQRAKGKRAQEPRREPGGRRQQGRTPLSAYT